MRDLEVHVTPALLSGDNVVNNCIHINGTWYYDHQTTAAPPSMYAELVQTARDRICIWDPYVDEYGFPAFTFVPDDIEIQCLTSMGYDGTQNLNDTRVGRFVMAIDGQRNQWVSRMTVKYYNVRHDDCGKYAFHDRYLFVDDNVYVVGSSLPHHVMRNGSTAIHRIESLDARELIRNMYERYWNHRWTEQAFPIGGVHFAI